MRFDGVMSLTVGNLIHSEREKGATLRMGDHKKSIEASRLFHCALHEFKRAIGGTER